MSIREGYKEFYGMACPVSTGLEPKPDHRRVVLRIRVFSMELCFYRDPLERTFWDRIMGRMSIDETYRIREDGLPSTASDWVREQHRRLTDPDAYDIAKKEIPDLSQLTDEEVEERPKTAVLGQGIIAERGLRMFLRGEFSSEPSEFRIPEA